MTTTQNPDQIRREIDMTQERLSQDVDVLTESVRPANVARRTTSRMGSTMARARDAVMGSAHEAADTGSEGLHGAAGAVRDAPDAARRQARGNPLAAGAVALAAGWLGGALLPACDADFEESAMMSSWRCRHSGCAASHARTLRRAASKSRS